MTSPREDAPRVMVTGAFPRTKGFIRLVASYSKGRVDREGFVEKAFSTAIGVLAKLKKVGLDVGTDLMYLCDDLFNPLSEDVEGVEKGWLVRFYDNNFFVRSIVVKGRVSLRREAKWLDERFTFASGLRERIRFDGFALSLPGPLTLAAFSYVDGRVYNSVLTLALDYATNVLALAVKRATELGMIVELHEPQLCFVSRELLDEIEPAYKELAGLSKELHVLTYFAKPNERALSVLPRTVVLGLDLVEAPKEALGELASLARAFAAVRLGLVDARNTRLEDESELVKIVRLFSERGANVAYLAPNTMTEFLPEVVAYRKVRLLKRVSRGVRA